MKFRFPVVIIDEDFRSENISGSGIRALAEAIEKEGVEVLGLTSYGDLTSFAQQSSRASCFILSIDDDELMLGETGPDGELPELATAILELRAFVTEVRRRNADIPIFLYGETRTSRHIPNDVLRELHGFIHMFEDTPEFVARHIIRETKVYLDSLAPPFFKELVKYADEGSYSWHCPGHSGGVAFLKNPLGQMFHQFFGENMLRADVCNAVDELGQLLDHTGPVAASERNAARIFSADHLFFVTNGTSTSNKIVWHANVAPGDIVLVDRNCHKSILHAITMTHAIPVFLTPTRNHFGIIGPIPRDEFKPENIRKKIEANPFAREALQKNPNAKPRILTITQSTYDGVIYNVEHIKDLLGDLLDTLHFDEAWLPHAEFHEFYRDMHAIGAGRPRTGSLVFATHSTHKLLAGISQASQIVVQDSENRTFDKHRFNEAYLMHTSTSPQYAIIASCDVAAAMMEPPGGTALVEESIAEAIEFRRAMRKVDAEYGDDWFFSVWGPDTLPEEGIGSREDWILRPNGPLARLRPARGRLQHAGPDQGHHHHPGPGRGRRVRRDRDSGGDRHQVPGRARHHRREDGPLLVLHHVHDRHHQGPLELDGHRAAAVQGRLRQQPAALARAARVRGAVPDLRARRPARPLHADPRRLPRQRHRAPDHRDVSLGHGAGDEGLGRVRQARAPRDRPRAARRAGRARHQHPAHAVSAGHSAADPGRALQCHDRQLPAFRP